MKVFVYGTLKTGERNWHKYFAPVKGKPAKVRGHRLHEREDGVAVMVPTGLARDIIHGEIFDLDRTLLRSLDFHEGIGSGVYDRRKVTTLDEEECYAYVNPRLGYLPPIKGGRWSAPTCPICDSQYIRRFPGWMGTLYIHEMRGRWPEDWCVVFDPEAAQGDGDG